MLHHNAFPISDLSANLCTLFSESVLCSVEDFEAQKAFYSNEEKRKDKRSLMSNDHEDENL